MCDSTPIARLQNRLRYRILEMCVTCLSWGSLMYCIDTAELPAIPKEGGLLHHFEGVYVRDVEALAPILTGIRADSGNGEFCCQMHSGNITKRRKSADLPDLSRKTA